MYHDTETLSIVKGRILSVIREKRRRCLFSQPEFSAMVGLSQSQYSKKEKGKQEFTLSELLIIHMIFKSEGDKSAVDTTLKRDLESWIKDLSGSFVL